MLLLSKSLSQLILPPGGLILLATLGLIFWKKYWGKPLVALSLVLLWFLSTEPVRDALTSSLEYQYPPLQLEQMAQLEQLNHHQATIILLGGGILENSLDYDGLDTLSSTAMMRTIYAAKIAKTTSFDIFPTGGTPLREDSEPEANIMKDWLIWFGITESRIFVENQAHTTWENATLTKVMLDDRGIDTVILVTSAWHIPRSVWCFEQQGLHVIPAPTAYLTERDEYDLRSFLPSWVVLADSGYALHEYLGLLWYKIQYP